MSKHAFPEDRDSADATTAEPPTAQLPPSPTPQRPSPTSRARRAAVGAGLDPALHRPSPRPQPQPAAQLQPHSEPRALALENRPATVAPSATRTAGRPEPDAEIPPPISTASRPVRGVYRALVAVLLVIIVALGATAWWLENSQDPAGSRIEREQALSTAKAAAPVILSYNYRQLDKDIAAGRARLTGRASSDYVDAMTKTIKPAAAKTHAVVQAQTEGAGVESVAASGKQLTVLVFGEQKVTNTSLTQPRTDLFRIRLTLNLVGKRWFVSKLDPI